MPGGDPPEANAATWWEREGCGGSGARAGAAGLATWDSDDAQRWVIDGPGGAPGRQWPAASVRRVPRAFEAFGSASPVEHANAADGEVDTYSSPCVA